jgi:hypothetical protein
MASATRLTMAGYSEADSSEHVRQVAALFACGDHGAVDGRKLLWKLRQRPAQRAARVDVGADGGQQVALLVVLDLFAQSGQGAFDRQAAAHQTGELTSPHGAFAGAEGATSANGALPPRQGAGRFAGRARGDGLDQQGHELLRAQLGAGGFQAVGFERAFAQGTIGLQGFKTVGGHI